MSDEIALNDNEKLVVVRIKSSTIECDCYKVLNQKNLNFSHHKQYKFSRKQPPLLRDNADILSISSEVLKENIGTAKCSNTIYVVEKYLWGKEGPKIVRKIDSTYSMNRSYRWMIVNGSVHYSEDLDMEVKIFSGFKESKKIEMTKALDLELSAEWPVTKLSTEVKASLKITEENYREWSNESTTITKRKFSGGKTYVTWHLVDSIYLKKDSSIVRYLTSPDDVPKVMSVEPPQTLEDYYDCVINTYEDKIEDKNAAIINSAVHYLTDVFHKV